MLVIFSYLIFLNLLFCMVLLLYISVKDSYKKELTFDTENYSKINFPLLLALLLISFIVGFRYDIGVDWYGYKQYFDSGSFIEGHMEYGYRLINRLIFNTTRQSTHMFFIVALISWLFTFKGYPKQFLPLGIYFLFCDEFIFFCMNGVRQFIAMGFFLYALKYMINRNLKYYLLWMIFAAFFHITILLLLPIYYIPWKRLYNRYIWYLLIFASYTLSQSTILINGIEQIFTTLSDYFPIFRIYTFYFSSDFFEIHISKGYNLGVIFRSLITLFIIYFSKDVLDNYPKAKPYIVLVLIGALLSNLFFSIQIISRFILYLDFLRSFVLALIIYHLWISKKNYLFILLIPSLYFLLFLWNIQSNIYQFTF